MKRGLIIVFALLLMLAGCAGAVYSNDAKLASIGNSYNLMVKEQNVDAQRFAGHVQFEGMDTIWRYAADEDCELEIRYLIDLSKGRAKLVLIQPDGTVVEIVENTNGSGAKDVSSSSLPLKKGDNRIKLVAADKAEFTFEIEIDEGDFSGLGMK